jgi:hypothetical protein
MILLCFTLRVHAGVASLVGVELGQGRAGSHHQQQQAHLVPAINGNAINLYWSKKTSLCQKNIDIQGYNSAFFF